MLLKKSYYSNIIFFFVFITFSISGYYTGSFYNYIALFLFIMWVVIAFLEYPKALIYGLLKGKIIYFLLFLIFYFISSIIVGKLSYIAKYLGTFILHFLSPMLVFNYYKRREYLLRIVCKISLVIWLFFCIKAIIFYMNNPTAARILASDVTAFGNISIGGGYGLGFGSAILSVFFVDNLVSNLRINKNCFKVITIIILSVLVFMTESTITTFGMILGWSISLFSNIYFKKSNKYEAYFQKKILVLSSIIIAFSLIMIYINDIGTMLLNITNNKIDIVLFRRINRIAEKLVYFGKNVSTSNYVDERLQYVLQSVNTFLDNPIFGVGYKFGNVFNLSSSYGIGTHSAWFDSLASFGVIGGFPYIMIYLSSFYEDKRRNYLPFHSYIFTTSFLCLFNPFQTFQSCFALFFMIPGLSWYYTSIVSTNKRNVE